MIACVTTWQSNCQNMNDEQTWGQYIERGNIIYEMSFAKKNSFENVYKINETIHTMLNPDMFLTNIIFCIFL